MNRNFRILMKPIVMTSPPGRDRPIHSQSKFPIAPDLGYPPDTRVDARWSPHALIRGLVVTTVAVLWLLNIEGANATSAATREQSIQLGAGWNSVFLEV